MFQITARSTGVIPVGHAATLLAAVCDAVGVAVDSENFSASPLEPLPPPDANGLLFIEEGCVYTFCVAALAPDGCNALSKADLPAKLEAFDLSFDVIGTERFNADPMQWYDQALGRTIQRVELEWTTATAFSLDGRVPPLPTPEALFRAWIRRWDGRAPIEFGEDGVAMLATSIRLRPIIVRGVPWRDDRGRISAFVGKVSMSLARTAPPFIGIALDVLSRYSEFSGTGIRTHAGMGCTRIEPARAQPN